MQANYKLFNSAYGDSESFSNQPVKSHYSGKDVDN